MKARIYWLCATAAGRLLARSVAWLAGFAGQVFTDRISAVRAVIIFSFVDLGSSIHLLATAQALDVLRAQEALAPIESPATASQMTLTCTFIPRSSSGLPA